MHVKNQNDAMDKEGDIFQTLKIGLNSGLKAAILDFGKGKLYQKWPLYVTLQQHDKNENDTTNNKWDIYHKL